MVEGEDYIIVAVDKYLRRFLEPAAAELVASLPRSTAILITQAITASISFSAR